MTEIQAHEDLPKGKNKKPANVKEVKYRLGSHNEKITILTNHINTLKNRGADNEAEIAKLTAENKDLIEQIKKLRNLQAEHLAQIEELKNYTFEGGDLDALRAEKEKLEQTVDKLKAELIEATTAIEETIEEIEEI